MFKSSTCIALKFSLSILTLKAVVCLPNKVNPFAFKWAAIWAGPVSFAITKELSLIKEDNWEISKIFSPSNIDCALISLASLISVGPGATTTLNLLLNLLLISSINWL